MKTMKKKMTTAILAVITCLSSTVAVLDHNGNSSIPIGCITADAASSDRILSFDWNIINNVGRQARGSDSCACFALAYGRSILDGYAHSWAEYDGNGGYSQTGTCAMWSYGDYTKHYASSQLGALQAAYDQLNMGRPVVAFVTGSRSTWHWITLLGYRAGADRNDLSPYDFYMTDPCKNASSYENMGEAGYSVKYEGSSGYAYVTANSGGVPLGGAEPVIPENPVGREMSESEAAGRTIPDGVYCIGSALGDTLFVDPAPGSDVPAPSAANVALWSYDAGTLPDAHDQFTFTYLNNGFYKVTQKGTDMCLDVANCDLHSGTNVQLYEWHDSPAQMWSVRKTESGYSLQARCNGFYLDVYESKGEAGSNILVWEGHGGLNQQFRLVKPVPKLTIHYNANGGGTVNDSAYYVADNNGMIYDFASNTLYTTVWNQNEGSANGLRNATSFGLVREGYRFLGWSLNQDKSSTIFDQDNTALTTKDLFPELSKDTTITMYAVWDRLCISGDINEDNKVNIADLELLRDWILADKKVTLNDPKAADLNEDCSIDARDLTLLKQLLLKNSGTNLTLNKTNIRLNPDVTQTFQLTASYPDVTYTSSDDELASVNSSGIVTAKGKGEVTITAKSAQGGTAICHVHLDDNFKKVVGAKSEFTTTPVQKTDTREVFIEDRPVIVGYNMWYWATRDANTKIRQFRNASVSDLAALGLDRVYGEHSTLSSFGCRTLYVTTEQLNSSPKYNPSERSSGSQNGVNKATITGYDINGDGMIWFIESEVTQPVRFYAYQDTTYVPAPFDNE